MSREIISFVSSLSIFKWSLYACLVYLNHILHEHNYIIIVRSYIIFYECACLSFVQATVDVEIVHTG